MALPFSKVLFFMVMHLHCLDNGAAIAILGQGRSQFGFDADNLVSQAS
jgi:hypothetical protein